MGENDGIANEAVGGAAGHAPRIRLTALTQDVKFLHTCASNLNDEHNVMSKHRKKRVKGRTSI